MGFRRRATPAPGREGCAGCGHAREAGRESIRRLSRGSIANDERRADRDGRRGGPNRQSRPRRCSLCPPSRWSSHPSGSPMATSGLFSIVLQPSGTSTRRRVALPQMRQREMSRTRLRWLRFRGRRPSPACRSDDGPAQRRKRRSIFPPCRERKTARRPGGKTNAPTPAEAAQRRPDFAARALQDRLPRPSSAAATTTAGNTAGLEDARRLRGDPSQPSSPRQSGWSSQTKIGPSTAQTAGRPNETFVASSPAAPSPVSHTTRAPDRGAARGSGPPRVNLEKP